MSLSDAKVRNAKPGHKPYKIYDGDGLFLLIAVTGAKCWRLKYQFAGKEKLLALGTYPEVSLSDARDSRAEARKIVKAGKDPSTVKKDEKREIRLRATNSFETVALEWHGKQKARWSENTADIHLKRLAAYAFPKLGERPIAEIKAPEVLDMLRVIETKRALETAHRVKQDCGKIFMYAIATGRAERNPVPDLNGALESPVTKHHASLDASELPEFFKKLESSVATKQTKLALKFLTLTFVRTIELRGAEWSEIDFKNTQWRIPAIRMKMKQPHIVPLSRQSIALLHELKELTGEGKYLFPNRNSQDSYMTENTMLYALYDMDYDSRATCHGFRSTASTTLNEHEFPSDVIERQLAHCERDQVRAAYNYAQYLPQRREMMQWWADYLDDVAKKSDKDKN